MSLPRTQEKPSRKTPHTQLPIDLNHELSAGFAHRFIRFKLYQLSLRGVRSAERQELAQDLKIRIFRAFSSFDPAIADWDVFVTTIVERQVASIIRNRRRKKRQGVGTIQSLADETIDCDGQVCEIADTVSLDDVARHTREFELADLDRMVLEHDLPIVLGRLSEKEHAICRALQTQSISQVARSLGVPRTTIQSLLRRLRDLLDEEGFRDFL